MAAHSPDISFAIPCHNEAGTLRELVRQIEAQMAALNRASEIVIVDDGSSDESWAVLKDLAGKPENAEQIKDINRTGSGPFKIVRWKPTEEIVLERFGEHFRAPKVERWIMRIVPNAEATLGMLKRGELNFLGFFGGDPEVLVKFAKENPDIVIRTEVDVGFEFVAFNNRRAPFDDVAFRRALSLCIDRKLMVSAAWQDFAIPANSHVSPVLSFWHDPSVDDLKTGVAISKKILADAGYRLVGGKLYYPAGKQEKLTTE